MARRKLIKDKIRRVKKGRKKAGVIQPWTKTEKKTASDQKKAAVAKAKDDNMKRHIFWRDEKGRIAKRRSLKRPAHDGSGRMGPPWIDQFPMPPRAIIIGRRRIPSIGTLARMTGLHPSAISHILSARREPLISTAAKVAAAVGVTLDEFNTWYQGRIEERDEKQARIKAQQAATATSSSDDGDDSEGDDEAAGVA